MHAVQTAGVPPNQGRIYLPRMSCFQKIRKALRKIVDGKRIFPGAAWLSTSIPRAAIICASAANLCKGCGRSTDSVRACCVRLLEWSPSRAATSPRTRRERRPATTTIANGYFTWFYYCFRVPPNRNRFHPRRKNHRSQSRLASRLHQLGADQKVAADSGSALFVLITRNGSNFLIETRYMPIAGFESWGQEA